ncbi:MAG: CPBP family glutamic-type intramembrane protease [Promethearchaeota archaeon]
MKGLIIPILAIILSSIFYFVDQLEPNWIGINPYPKINSGFEFYIETVILLGGILSLILIAEGIISIVNKKQPQEVSSLTFIDTIRRTDRYSLFVTYPLTLLCEEIFFRGVIFNLLLENTTIFNAIFISAGIFGLYHIHILIAYRNPVITLVYIIYSFLLGLLLGRVVLYFGILACWAIHLILISYIYIRLNSILLGNKEDK